MNLANLETVYPDKSLETLIQELPPDLRGEVRDFVEFILAKRLQSQLASANFPLRGTVLHYDAPFAPVAESDWEAAQ